MTIDEAIDNLTIHLTAKRRWRVLWKPTGEVLEELEAGCSEAQASAAAVLWAGRMAQRASED